MMTDVPVAKDIVLCVANCLCSEKSGSQVD